MTSSDSTQVQHEAAQVLARELAAEQAHVDRVYAELDKARARAALVEVEGMSRGRTDRTGDIRDEEITGLFERDALVFTAGRRQHTLDRQHEGLVFGRLDLDHDVSVSRRTGSSADGHGGAQTEREVRYVGRLGVRDDDYEPLVIDWRAPAAAPFYRATPVEPLDVVRRRVLRCRGEEVIGVEDDLLATEAPQDLVILGDGALLAALTRSRTGRMRDIVATIQAHQDEAIRAPARGVTEITGGPGTGKTVVALHRAAYLLYADRRRFETGGILVIGPSSAYTAYIERVLPSLGEESVTLRSLGDLLDVTTATRLDPPDVAALKGSLRIRRVLARAARDVIPGSPRELRAMVGGRAIHLRTPELDRARAQVLRRHTRNHSTPAMLATLARAAWGQMRTLPGVHSSDAEEFLATFEEHLDVEDFLARWWRPIDPREVLLWLADPERTQRYAVGVLSESEADALSVSMRTALAAGSWSVADAALIDDLSPRLGLLPVVEREQGFYQVEEVDDAYDAAVAAGHLRGGESASARLAAGQRREAGHARAGIHLDATAARDALLHGRIESPSEYAHVLVDEAQDLSPMQWRMVGRRGRWASWTVVGDAAQASWSDAQEAARARDEAFGSHGRRHFHMETNYRNSREIFEHASAVIRASVPDADIPVAVRDTGVEPVDRVLPAADIEAELDATVRQLADEVDGEIAIVTPSRWDSVARRAQACLSPDLQRRVVVVDPLSTKGLEYDATVVLDPDEITATSPGGVRILYVVLTRAAQRMHILRPA
ncbi:MAG: AAA family ATPase [Micrococcales bacterium]|nr:AAA family ATPase [Micrococcales bacterium]